MATNFAIEPQGLEAAVALTTPLPEARPVIELDHIHKIYTMGDVEVHALRGISLTIRQGECVAIMGTCDTATARCETGTATPIDASR